MIQYGRCHITFPPNDKGESILRTNVPQVYSYYEGIAPSCIRIPNWSKLAQCTTILPFTIRRK